MGPRLKGTDKIIEDENIFLCIHEGQLAKILNCLQVTRSVHVGQVLFFEFSWFVKFTLLLYIMVEVYFPINVIFTALTYIWLEFV